MPLLHGGESALTAALSHKIPLTIPPGTIILRVDVSNLYGNITV